MLKFGQKLRLWRKKMNISLDAISKGTGIQVFEIILLERGRLSPTEQNLEQLAQWSPLGLDLGMLQQWVALDADDQQKVLESLELLTTFQPGHIMEILREEFPNPRERLDMLKRIMRENGD